MDIVVMSVDDSVKELLNVRTVQQIPVLVSFIRNKDDTLNWSGIYPATW